MRNIIKNAFIMHYKKRWEIYRVLSIFLLVTLISTFVNMTLINVKADNSVGDKPSFEIQIDEAKPNPAIVGEDILIKGKIIPKPFEMKMESQKKEIVLVLDTSGSMNEKVGKHYYGTTKLDELKKAANNFIDKMKDVPDLKMGIVNYSTNANIDIDEFSNNSNKLHMIINNLNAQGGTNTGEGLRKAEYMLEQGDKGDVKKTIVFMSDGLPTYYSVYKNHQNVQKYYWVLKYSWNNGYYWEKEYYWKDEYYWDYYTSIDDTFPNYAGTGSSDEQGYCKKYAKKIGEIIKNNKSNVFSLGYGLGDKNSDANKIMKEIHESMGGTEKDFFATDTGAIDEIFSQIADKIKESYTIDNLEMDMNLKSEDGFTLKVGGNTVKLNNVIYKKVSENNEKIKYEADAVPFEFVIKGSKVGEYENLFKDSKGKFSWKDNDISIPITTPDNFITKIKANELPYIQVKLISEENINSKNINEEIEVKYEITTKPFKYNVDSSLIVSDAQLNFDLGNNFQLIEAGSLEKINENENKYKVKLDKIQYELQKEGQNQGEWVQTKPIEIKFKIKKSLNSGYGKLEFGEEKNNTILYTNFSGESTINTINTPIVNFEGLDLRHGIYNGINNDGTVNINTTIKSYPKEARINFGADFKYNGQKKVQLNVDKNIYIDGLIKIYKIDGNKLNLLYSIDKTGEQKNYNINLNNIGLNNEDKVLILYNGCAPNILGTFINIIQADNAPSVSSTINVIDKKMPELF
ncbi:VWA domain-containing protein [Clostridium botulinum]|uniref:VWA domain-containing protein n=1 Tax=Clostridium botulinum TaxID=1491 RepID=UPI0013C9B607|nr:VWA domain-containing protein [Clostridium botulinum]NFN19139.1 VWA domain-containing protein [Clostridium botulinum]NFN49677.1 VWA domain-containing protein [Clostridium botulinum]